MLEPTDEAPNATIELKFLITSIENAPEKEDFSTKLDEAVYEATKQDNINQQIQVAKEKEQRKVIEDLELNNKLDHPTDLIVQRTPNEPHGSSK